MAFWNKGMTDGGEDTRKNKLDKEFDKEAAP